jgi:hypothetical protein
MLRPAHTLLTASLLSFLLPAGPGPAAAWRVWTEPAGVKVLPDRAPPAADAPAPAIALDAVRGEWVGFQVAVRGDGGDLTGVDVATDDLESADGARLAVPRTHVYRAGLLTLTHYSRCFPRWDCAGYPPELVRRPGRFPDPLIPFADPYDPAHPAVGAPFDLPAGDTAAVYVDIRIPRETAPGRYVATWQVTAAGETAVPVAVAVVVHDVTLPRERRVATAYGFGASRIWRHHGGAGGPSEEDRARIERHYDQALREHLMDATTIDGPLPAFTFDADGHLEPPDWSAYDAAVAPRLDGGWWEDGQPPVRFATGLFEPGSGKGGLDDDQWAQAAAAFAEHLQARGWLERAWLYSSDEPFLPGHQDAYRRIPADVALLRRYTDLWDGHVMVTNPLDERLIGSVDIWCPVTPMYDDWYWVEGHAGRAAYDERRALGEELWFYNCNANFPPWAGYDIDAPLGHEPRVLKWGAYAERATGFLHWRANYWYTEDPWHDVANLDEFGPLFARNGDGLLIYPGDHDGTAGGLGSPEGVAIDGPVVSYRMKLLRDGLEDWELFLLAEDEGAGAFVQAQVARAYRQFGAHVETGDFDPANPPWTFDPAVLDDARAQVVAKVLHLRDPAAHPDPEAPPPVDPGPEPIAEPVAEPASDAAGGPDAARDAGVDAAGGDLPAPPPDVPRLPDVGADGSAGGDGGGGCAAGPHAGRGPGASPATLLALLVVLLLSGAAARRRSRAGSQGL